MRASELHIDPSNDSELLRWWHQYHIQMLNQETDLLRNGVLQDILAFRRYLELSWHDHALGYEESLARLIHISAALENLSNRLTVPYVQDSLPLALQHIVQPWIEKVDLKMQLPSSWEMDPPEHNRLIILFVQNLLQQLEFNSILPHHFDILLTHQNYQKQLICKALYHDLPSSSSVAVSSSFLQPFLETFKIFTKGQYTLNLQTSPLTWTLAWKTASNT